MEEIRNDDVLSRLLGAGSLGQVDVVTGSGVRQRRDVLGSRSDGHVARVRVVGLSDNNTTFSRYTYNEQPLTGSYC